MSWRLAFGSPAIPWMKRFSAMSVRAPIHQPRLVNESATEAYMYFQHLPCSGLATQGKVKSDQDNRGRTRSGINIRIADIFEETGEPQHTYLERHFPFEIRNREINNAQNRYLYEGQVKGLSSEELVRALSLLVACDSLGKNSVLMECVLKRISQVMEEMTANEVFSIIKTLKGKCINSPRQVVYDEAFVMLKGRLDEINSAADIVTLFYLISDTPENRSDLRQLEQKASKLTDQMTQMNMYRILYNLGRRQSRPYQLIRSLCSGLEKQELDLTTQQLVNVVYSLARVNYTDVDLLNKISHILSTPTQDLSHAMCFSLLKSVNSLHWRHESLMSKISGHFLKDIQDTRLVYICSLFTTCGKLGYMPPPLAAALPDALNFLEANLQNEPGKWLDIVWSLCLLEKSTTELAASVLNEDFVSKIKRDDKEDLEQLHEIQLRNVKACIELDINDFNKTSIVFPDRVQVPRNTGTSGSFHNSVWKVLSQIYPADSYFKRQEFVPEGHVIDIGFYADKNAEPQKLNEAEDLLANGSQIKKVAIKLLDYSDVVQPNYQPIGCHSLALRHLSKLGYVVVPIHFNEYPLNESVVKKTEFLLKKIKEKI